MARSTIQRRKSPPFAGDAKNQEARRKAIIRILTGEAANLERKAKKARKIIAQATSAQALNDRTLMDAASALAGDRESCDPFVVFQHEVAKLFGVANEWQAQPRGDRGAGSWHGEPWQFLSGYMLDGRINGYGVPVYAVAARTAATDRVDEARPMVESPANTRESTPANSAVSAASSIIGSVASNLEIDWTQEPCDSFEAAVRAKVLERIESSRKDRTSPFTTTLTLWDLEALLPERDSRPASDLRAVLIRYYKRQEAEEAAKDVAKALKLRGMISDAAREIIGPSNVIPFPTDRGQA